MENQFSINHFYQDKEWRDELLASDETNIYEDIFFEGKLCGGILAVKKKIRMLREEGIEIKNNKINMDEFLFRF